ncbi:MAG TPA: metallophosphoesterase family protein [Actinomycetota bacterium]
MLRIGVIADTHIPARSRVLPPAILEAFDGVDAILHAGDLNVRDVLVELEAVAPVHGVLGNNDDWSLHGVLPERARLDLGGLAIGMIHDSGQTQGRRRRLAAAFPGCRVVVFGHSHQPFVDDDGSLLLLNPGSAVDPRRARVPTVAILEIADSQPKATLLELPRRPAG